MAALVMIPSACKRYQAPTSNKVSFDSGADNDRLDGRNTDISFYTDGGEGDDLPFGGSAEDTLFDGGGVKHRRASRL